MNNSKKHFDENINRVNNLGVIHTSITVQNNNGMDISDILRTQYVMLVSALDYFIHEIVRIGILEIYNGKRKITKEFKTFIFEIDKDVLLNKAIMKNLDNEWLNYQIIVKNGYKSFQQADKIEEALSLLIDIEKNNKDVIWKNIANRMNMIYQEKNVKKQLNLIIERRNQIAHEADIEPTYKTKRNISQNDVNDSIRFINLLVDGIYKFVISEL